MEEVSLLRFRLPGGLCHTLEVNLQKCDKICQIRRLLALDLGLEDEQILGIRLLVDGVLHRLVDDIALLEFGCDFAFETFEVEINMTEALKNSISVKLVYLRSLHQVIRIFPKDFTVGNLHSYLEKSMFGAKSLSIKLFLRKTRLLNPDIRLDSLIQNFQRDYILCALDEQETLAPLPGFLRFEPRLVGAPGIPPMWFEFPCIRSHRHASFRLFHLPEGPQGPSIEKPIALTFEFDSPIPHHPLLKMKVTPSDVWNYGARYQLISEGLLTTANRLTTESTIEFITRLPERTFILSIAGRRDHRFPVTDLRGLNVKNLKSMIQKSITSITSVKFDLMATCDDGLVVLDNNTWLLDIGSDRLYVVPELPLHVPNFCDASPAADEAFCPLCRVNRPQLQSSCGHLYCRACAVSATETGLCRICPTKIFSFVRLVHPVKRPQIEADLLDVL